MPEEVLVAIKVNDTKVAFKSGYNKYLRVDQAGQVMGVSDAVGAMEQWEAVFQVRTVIEARVWKMIEHAVHIKRSKLST